MSLYRGLLLLLFLSGACSLVYELIWVRMLLVVFGVSTYAVSTVLTLSLIHIFRAHETDS